MKHFISLTTALLLVVPAVAQSHELRYHMIVADAVMAVAGHRVAVSDPAEGQVVMIDAETLEIVERVDLGGQPQSLLLLTAEAEHAH